MSCQCHLVGGPFIAEDPDCAVHGTAATRRDREVEELKACAQREDDPARLREIIDELAYIATNIY
ncbi:hypothetical protein [Paracoccus sp. ME4]|uniref:hypothetical protein n=1 Tax=Paracoccus sp. ME4 TaxID=3138066 RepID=UPI00398A914D